MTGFHEVFQSAPQVAHQAKELIDLEMRSNLLQKLIESGHPYGILLSQSNASSTNGSSEGLINFFFPAFKGEKKAILKYNPIPTGSSLVSSYPLTFATLAVKAYPFWLSSFFNAFAVVPSVEKRFGFEDGIMDTYEEEGQFRLSVGLLTTSVSKGSVLGSAKKNENFAQKLHLEGVFQQAFLAPIWLKLFAGENPSQERTRELVVGQKGVGLGTAAIKLAIFRGQEPYVIKTPKGERVAQINPGDPVGHIHLSHQASLIRQLSPLEKVSIMTKDLLGLFSAIDQPIEGGLKPEHQEVLARAKETTVIGISHLVRLFGRKTGLPTWKLDVLPELVQRFHQHDSQVVSKAFGGSRKVRSADVEMMVLTPEMRRGLVASLA